MQTRTTILLLFALLLVGAAAPSATAARGTLVVAVGAPNAPYAFVGTDGHAEGLDPDLGRALANVLGYRVVVIDSSPDAILPGVVSGKYDVGMLSAGSGPRPLHVDLVGYLSVGTSYYVTAGGPSVRAPAGLCGRSVAVARATPQADTAVAASAWCKTKGKARVKLLFTRDAAAAESALASGRVEIAMADSPVAARAVKRSNGRFRLAGGTDSGSVHTLAISSGNGLADEVLGALKDLIDDGTYATILARWGAQDAAVTTPTIAG
jgi:polar amino acid transport system substrate-binding protein